MMSSTICRRKKDKCLFIYSLFNQYYTSALYVEEKKTNAFSYTLCLINTTLTDNICQKEYSKQLVSYPKIITMVVNAGYYVCIT